MNARDKQYARKLGLAVFVAAVVGGWSSVSARPAAAEPVSFRHEVLPALAKQGCSAGACHGSPSGKGGFRLSLRGFDPQLDWRTLTREAEGRRVNRLRPADSLLLLKPTMRVSHGGGLKLRQTDPAYGILREWIAAGCAEDPADAPDCVGIDLQPGADELSWPGWSRPLRVLAEFDDGTWKDITRLTVYSSSDEQVATVDARGVVTAQAPGETTIMARYLDFVATADLRFLKTDESFVWEARPESNFIDHLVFARLQKLQIQPSAMSTDSEFLRRVYLDVIGILPTRRETEAFLADASPTKRDRLIERLLERDEYAEFWAQKWADVLRVKSSKLGGAGVHKFHRWLVSAVRGNMSYDRFATELLTAQGSTFNNPAAAYYRAAADPNDCAESTAQLFLGIRLQCAKCHNHPFDRWSQDNYYGIGAFFSRVRRSPAAGEDEVFVWLAAEGELVQPRTGQQMKPWLPLRGEIEVPAEVDRRAVLARWLVEPDNPFFARVAVNRIWAQLLGRGIVDPVDDFRADNPASHPELLNALARHFVESGYDQRQIIRLILRSTVYQLSSRDTASNKRDDKFFSHARARLLTAEQLLDAICQTTGVPEQFGDLPAGTRATGLPTPDYGSDFLKVFGQPARNTVCDCERGDEPKLAQTLQLINGPLIPRKLKDREGRLSRMLDDVETRAKAAGVPPDDGLVAWFRADKGALDAQGVPAGEGMGVRRWADQVDPDGGVEQPLETRRPTLVAASLAGLPALRFDGRDDLLHNTLRRLVEPGSPRTILVVGQMNDESGGALFTFGRARQDGSSVFAAQHVKIGGTYYLYSDGVNSAGNATAPVERLADLRQPFVTSFLSQGAGQKLHVRVNGALLPSQQPGAVGVDHGTSGFTIGSREDLPPGIQNWSGQISEVLVYNRALDDQQLAVVGSYLTTKYDLETEYPRKPIAAAPTTSDRELIQDFYLAALCRPPTVDELNVAAEHVRQSADRRRGLEDVAWALMNSKEFVFQH